MARGKAACNKWYEKTVNKSLFFLIGKFKRKSKLEIFVPKMILKYFSPVLSHFLHFSASA